MNPRLAPLLALLATGCPVAAPDAGPADASPDDAGLDGGGQTFDGGLPDAHALDAGADSGVDAGLDAGLPDALFYDGGPDCPVPFLEPVPANVGSIQTLVFDGSGSEAYPGREIVAWHFSMTPPRPLGVSFVPSPPTSSQPTYTTSIAGEYFLDLSVTDDQGRLSCDIATESFVVTPSADVHVELTWTTPGDLNPQDYTGADLDLHLWNLSYPATVDNIGDGMPDAWFMTPADAFWFNPFPNWGDFASQDDDPSLFLGDVVSGSGPELTTLATAPEGNGYRIGVHYYDDAGLGPSTARIDVYSNDKFIGSLERTMNHRDFWVVYDKTADALTEINTLTPNVNPPGF